MMVLMYSLTYFWLVIFIYHGHCQVQIKTQSNQDSFDDELDPEAEQFIPTDEWQEIKPGQSIPPGLHVRMDLTTGGKWAKLMDKDKTQDDSSSMVQVSEKDVSDKDELDDSEKISTYKVEELKAALKKFKNEKLVAENPMREQEVKSKFRSMEEIREALEEFDLHQESDLEVMKRLVAMLSNQSIHATAKHLALQDLEYYVHQIDNANDLVTFGGFAEVIKALNSSDTSIREESAHVIGSALQSNPKVQIEALRSGVLQKLLSLLSSTEEAMSVRKKCLFAISTLVRHFPLAQIKLAEYGGFQSMVNLFYQEGTEQLRIKAVRLINDLVVERQTAEQSEESDREERIKQYNKIYLIGMIKDLGWCRQIPSSLNISDHSKRESVLNAMLTLKKHCQNDFRTTDVIVSLKKLKNEYVELHEEEQKEGDENDYFKSLLDKAEDLLAFTEKSSYHKREEL